MSEDSRSFPLPCLTAGLPGVGGTLKQYDEDFVVEEIPAYLPEGEGEFLYLWVEKRGLSAEQLTSHLARVLGIAHQDIGMAGMKDRRAVTRQWISVPAKKAEDLPDEPHPQIQILERKRHRNKLRTGHLRGNRFVIRLRNPMPEALSVARAVAARLCVEGVPNYFGDQRFGKDAETLQLGLELLRGTRRPGSIPHSRRKFLLRLALSAAQSSLFNQALAERMQEGLLHTVLLGDVMQVAASGGPFVVEDVAAEQPRYDCRETLVTGPMFGPKMKAPAGTVKEREQRLLDGAQLTPGMFVPFDNLTGGTRRPYLILPQDLAVEPLEDDLQISVTLPSGSYATVLLREFQKTDVA